MSSLPKAFMHASHVVLIGFILLTPTTTHAQSARWAATNAQLTTAEFLQLYFQLELHHHEDDSALNSFNLVSFYPAQSPASAVVLVIQTYNDEGKSTENPKNRQAIREVSTSIVQQFSAEFGLPAIKKRWSVSDPSRAIIIKHVRVHDMQDILAVTIDGVTSFDPEDFKRAEARVRTAGGVWAW